MKKNLNIIQIRGIRGIIIALCVASCLIAGFIAFPGLILMNLWNMLAFNLINLPPIGLIQGVLLWGIFISIYFLLRKDRFIVCVKSPKGLSEDELKSVFANIKEQSKEDMILQAMMKSKEAELKIQSEQRKNLNNENCEQINDTK